jgi:hypothetical protein
MKIEGDPALSSRDAYMLVYARRGSEKPAQPPGAVVEKVRADNALRAADEMEHNQK